MSQFAEFKMIAECKMKGVSVFWTTIAVTTIVLALPLSAQTAATSSAQVQTGTQVGSSTSTNAELSKYNAQYATGKPLQMQSHEGFMGHLNPMARKAWVNRQVTPVKDRLNELDQLSASNAQQIRDLDARTQAELQRVNTATQQADARATQAGDTAVQAQTLALQSATRTDQMSIAVAGMDQYQTSGQVEIRFRAGQSELGQNAKAALDQIASQVQGQRGYLIDVQGYSSLRGLAGLKASRRMAAAVTRYLVEQQQVPLYRVRQISLGNTPIEASSQASDQGENPEAQNSKATMRFRGSIVEVNVMHNSLSALSASNVDGSPMGAAQSGSAQSSSSGIVSQPTRD